MYRPAYIKKYDFDEHCFNNRNDSLKLSSTTVDIIPDNIHHLSLTYCDITNMKLPKNLKKISIIDCAIHKKNFYYYIYLFFQIIYKKFSLFENAMLFFHNGCINHKININSLPDSIEYLEISTNCYVMQYPIMLQKLLIYKGGYNFDFYNFNLKLPNSLTHLSLPPIKYNNLELPPNLKYLNLKGFIGKIIYPPSLKYLNVYSSTFNFSTIPSTVKNIGIRSNNISIDNLPTHIKKIRLYVHDDNTNILNLPTLLKKIYIDYYGSFCKDINIKIPFNCEKIFL